MKKLFANCFSRLCRNIGLALAVPIAVSVMAYGESDAQVHIGVQLNYVPPYWAPPYDNVSTIRYYYLPDCDIYYDVWDHEFWYFDGAVWIESLDEPAICVDIPLSSAYIVLIDRHVERPWLRHEFYVRNYPRHGYDRYRDIVVKNRIITNLRPNHELVPRAYNENTGRVTFMQHPNAPAVAGHTEPNRSGTIAGSAPTQPAPSQQWHHQVHEVPMMSIAPSMPQESRKLNYGGGQNRAPRTMPAPAPPQRNIAPPARPQNAPQGRPQGAPQGGRGRH